MGPLSTFGTWLIVVLILVFVWWCARKLTYTSQGGLQSKYMKIHDRIVLSQDKSIILVQIGEKYYLLGVASSSINIISEVSKDDIVEFTSDNQNIMSGLNFKELLQKAGGKNKNGD